MNPEAGAAAQTADVDDGDPAGPPGFGERGRMRRRARFLRKARELAYRDLGGLVFDLHRFGRRHDALVLAKLETIGRIDGELRALEATLRERRSVTVLREAGVAACPRCAAIHGSDDRFCPNCGLAMDLHAERPMAAAPAYAAPPPAGPVAQPTAPAQAAVPTPTASPTQAATPAPAQSPIQGATPPAVPTQASTPATPEPAPTPATPTPPPAASDPTHDAPAPPTSRPVGPAPAMGGERGDTKDRSSVDQPTEIVRPTRDS